MPSPILVLAPFIDGARAVEAFAADNTMRHFRMADAQQERYNFGFRPLVKRFGLQSASLLNRLPAAAYYLQCWLRQHGYDAMAAKNFEDIEQRDYAAVVVSTTFVLDSNTMKFLVSEVRRQLGQDIHIIFGGPFIYRHIATSKDVLSIGSKSSSRFLRRLPQLGNSHDWFSLLTSSWFEDENVTYIAAEFGEVTLLAVLEALSANRDLTTIGNLMIPKPDGYFYTGEQPEDYSINQFPRWDLLDEVPDFLPLRTSVGCPYKCEYCDYIKLHPRVKIRSAESLAQEVSLAVNCGIRRFMVADDNIFISKHRLQEVATNLASQNVKWGGFFRADTVDSTNAQMLADSGCFYAQCGVESGDQRILDAMHKDCKLEDAKEGIISLLEVGINAHSFLMLGFPGETKESIDNTATMINEFNSVNGPGFYSYSISVLRVIAGTGLADEEAQKRFGISGYMYDWQHETMDFEEAITKWYPYLIDESSSLPMNGCDDLYWAADNNIDTTTKRTLCQAKRSLIEAIAAGDPDAAQRSFEVLATTITKKPCTSHWQNHFTDVLLNMGGVSRQLTL